MSTNPKNAAAQVVSPSPQTSEITIYTGGPAIVREERQVTLAEGKSSIALDGLPETYVPGSLTIAKVAGASQLKLAAFSYRPAALSLEAILEKAVGEQIELTSGDTTIAGKLRYIIGNQLVLEQNGKAVVVANDGSLSVDASVIAGISTTASVRLDTLGQAGDFKLGIMYASEGLSWAPRFEAYYDAKSERLSRFACWVDIVNNTGAPLAETKFQLIAGYNSGYQPNYNARSRGGRVMAMAASMPMGGGLEAASFGADAAEVETVGEQKLYSLPNELAVARGETKTTALLLAEDVPVKAEYFLTGGYYQPASPSRGRQEKLPVNVRLKLVNGTDSKLGVALPPGQVNFFEPDSKGSLQRTDTCHLTSHVAAGESFELLLPTPSRDVKAQRRLVSAKDDPVPAAEVAPDAAAESTAVVAPAEKKKKEAPRFRVESRELVLFNFKDKEVEVVVADSIPQDAQFVKPIGSSVKNLSTTPGAATFTVAVPAGGEVKVAYTIKFRIN